MLISTSEDGFCYYKFNKVIIKDYSILYYWNNICWENRMMGLSVEMTYSSIFRLWVACTESKTEKHGDLQSLFCGPTFQVELL